MEHQRKCAFTKAMCIDFEKCSSNMLPILDVTSISGLIQLNSHSFKTMYCIAQLQIAPYVLNFLIRWLNVVQKGVISARNENNVCAEREIKQQSHFCVTHE